MDRSRFYFKQKVKTGELNGAFDDVEAAIQSFIGSFNYKGIAAGAEVTENSPTNMTAVVSGPATVFDQNQQRIAWFPNQIVNCALDEDGSSTTVTNPGQERWVSIFAQFRSVQSEPRVDGHGTQIYFRETEGFQLNVVQGATAASNPTPPALRSDQILLADIKVVYGQTTITNADISTARTELVYSIPGSPTAINERSLQDVLEAMLGVINALNASQVSVVGVPSSPYSITAGTLIAVLTQLLGNLNTTQTALTGINTVGAISDSPLSLAGGTLLQTLTQLLAHINDASALLARANTFTVGPQTLNQGAVINGNAAFNGTDGASGEAVTATGGTPNGRAIYGKGKGTGNGVRGDGGDAVVSNTAGGSGLRGEGGTGLGTGAGGAGARGIGGDGGVSGTGGPGLRGEGGDNNGPGAHVTGDGTAPGLLAEGGSGNGPGVDARGDGSAPGVLALGGSSGAGVIGRGGATAAVLYSGDGTAGNPGAPARSGVIGKGDEDTDAPGVYGEGGGNGYGGLFYGGPDGQHGIYTEGTGDGYGIRSKGGPTNGYGGLFIGTANGAGLEASAGAGTGNGIIAKAFNSGNCVYAEQQAGVGSPIRVFHTSGDGPAIHIQIADISKKRGAIFFGDSGRITEPVEGDLWFNSAAGKLEFCADGEIYAIDMTWVAEV